MRLPTRRMWELACEIGSGVKLYCILGGSFHVDDLHAQDAQLTIQISPLCLCLSPSLSLSTSLPLSSPHISSYPSPSLSLALPRLSIYPPLWSYIILHDGICHYHNSLCRSIRCDDKVSRDDYSSCGTTDTIVMDTNTDVVSCCSSDDNVIDYGYVCVSICRMNCLREKDELERIRCNLRTSLPQS